MGKSTFRHKRRNGLDILSIAPRLFPKPTQRFTRRYEIEGGAKLNIVRGFGGGSRSIDVTSIQDIDVEKPSIFLRPFGYGSLVFRVPGSSDSDPFTWAGIKNSEQVKSIILSMRDCLKVDDSVKLQELVALEKNKFEKALFTWQYMRRAKREALAGELEPAPFSDTEKETIGYSSSEAYNSLEEYRESIRREDYPRAKSYANQVSLLRQHHCDPQARPVHKKNAHCERLALEFLKDKTFSDVRAHLLLPDYDSLAVFEREQGFFVSPRFSISPRFMDRGYKEFIDKVFYCVRNIDNKDWTSSEQVDEFVRYCLQKEIDAARAQTQGRRSTAKLSFTLRFNPSDIACHERDFLAGDNAQADARNEEASPDGGIDKGETSQDWKTDDHDESLTVAQKAALERYELKMPFTETVLLQKYRQRSAMPNCIQNQVDADLKTLRPLAS